MAASKVTNWGAVLALASMSEYHFLPVLRRFFADTNAMFPHDRESIQSVRRIEALLNAPRSGLNAAECYRTLVKFLEQCNDRLVVAVFANVLKITEQPVQLVYEGAADVVLNVRLKEERCRKNSYPQLSLRAANRTFASDRLERLHTDWQLYGNRLHPSAPESLPDPLGSRSRKVESTSVQTELQQQSEATRSSGTQTTLTFDPPSSALSDSASVASPDRRPVVHDVGTNTSSASVDVTRVVGWAGLDDMVTAEDLDPSRTQAEETMSLLSSTAGDQNDRLGLMVGFSFSDNDAINVSHMSDADIYEILMVGVPCGEPIEELMEGGDNLGYPL